jgi:hypothetical protein
LLLSSSTFADAGVRSSRYRQAGGTSAASARGRARARLELIAQSRAGPAIASSARNGGHAGENTACALQGGLLGQLAGGQRAGGGEKRRARQEAALLWADRPEAEPGRGRSEHQRARAWRQAASARRATAGQWRPNTPSKFS